MREVRIMKNRFGLFDAGYADFFCLAHGSDACLSGSVTIVVEFVPGGGIDAIGRVIADLA
jgi:hypothetical protein